MDEERIDYQKAAQLNVELGLNYLKQQQFNRAHQKLNRAKKLAPHLPQVHYAYGYFLESIGEILQAEKSYQKALQLKPQGGDEHNNYGAFLCRQHRYPQAEKHFLRALKDANYTFSAQVYENAGLCMLATPDYLKARHYLEKALQHDPTLTNALLALHQLEKEGH